MNIKKIAILVGVIVCLGIASSFSSVSGVENPKLVEGHYIRVSKLMFENHLLVDSAGLSVIGVHTLAGQTTSTDLVVVGTHRNAGMYALQGYYPNMTNHLPVDYHSDNNPPHDADIIRDMVKFLNPISGNMEVIYAEGNWMDDDGKIVKQDFVNPTKLDGALVPKWSVSTNEEVIALTLGNFDANAADLEVAGLCLDGDVYVINNIESSSLMYWIHDQDAWTWSDFRSDQVKTAITEIDDLDGNNPTQDDIVFGWYTNVTAISTNSSNREIWNVNVDYFITDIVAVDDINSDGLQDVVATSKDGVYLLNGADGSILNSIIETDAYYRDVEIFNNTAIITGNDDGDLIVWDINTASANFGEVVCSTNWYGRDIYDILDIGDLDSDGINEFAVGGFTLVGVVNGTNLSSIWARSPYGSSWNGQSINVYDMALLEDLDDDGFEDFAVTGYAINVQDTAVFVFGSYGQLQFVPDLQGYGYVDSDCDDSSHTFVFTASASQAKGLPITASITIDGDPITLTPDGSDWAAGVGYSYSSTYTDGSHTYFFTFTDGIDTVTTSTQTFQVGNCGNGGLEIPGAGIWMLLASIGLGIAITLLVFRKRFIR